MAFFEELSRTLSDKGKEAAQMAKEAAGALQMRAQIVSEKSKLKELYGAVGVLYYKKHRDDEDVEFGDLFREIGNVLANVAAMEEKIQHAEGTRICPNCQQAVKRDDLFCSRCGTALGAQEDADGDGAQEDLDESRAGGAGEEAAPMETVAESEVVPEEEAAHTGD